MTMKQTGASTAAAAGEVPQHIIDDLAKRLTDEPGPVTFRWICYQHACPVHVARAALRACIKQWPGKLAVTYCLSGVRKADGQRTVRLVNDDALEAASAELEPGALEQVYAVAPTVHSKDAAALHAAALEQTRRLVAALLAGDRAPATVAFETNSLSSVGGAGCPRVETAAPPSAEAADAKQERPAGRASTSMVGRAGIKSEPQAGAKQAAMGEKAAPAAGRRAVSDPAGGAKQKKAAGSLAAAFGKAPAGGVVAKKSAVAPAAANKPCPASTAAKAPPPAAAPAKHDAPAKPVKDKDGPEVKPARVVLDDEDEEEEESPLPSKPPPSRRRVVLDDDDDDEFEMDPPQRAPAAASAKPEAVAVPSKRALAADEADAARQVDGPKAADDAADRKAKRRSLTSDADRSAEKAASVANASGQDAGIGAAAMEVDTQDGAPTGLAAGSGSEIPAAVHPVYGAQPHPDAEIQMMSGKAFWTWINDRGEEVSQPAHKTAPAAASRQASAQPTAPRMPVQKAEPAPAHQASEKGAAKGSKAAAKPTKKNAKPAAGGRDIRSMFAKR